METLWGPSYLQCQWLNWPLLPQLRTNTSEIDTGSNFIFTWRLNDCCLVWHPNLSVSPNRGQYIDKCFLPGKSISMWPLMVFELKCFVFCQGLETKRLQVPLLTIPSQPWDWVTERETGIEMDRWGGASGGWQHWYQHHWSVRFGGG